MKKITILFIISIMLTACTNREIVVIDGCQYIKTTVVSEGVTETLEHKGNCTNPIHVWNNKPDSIIAVGGKRKRRKD